MAACFLIIYRKGFHVLADFHMRSFFKAHAGIPEMDDTGYFKVTVIFAGMAPADQVPVESIEDKTDRFQLPFRYLVFVVFIFYFKYRSGHNGGLQYWQVTKI